MALVAVAFISALARRLKRLVAQDRASNLYIPPQKGGERHLEVRIGNVGTETGGRRVLGAIGSDPKQSSGLKSHWFPWDPDRGFERSLIDKNAMLSN